MQAPQSLSLAMRKRTPQGNVYRSLFHFSPCQRFESHRIARRSSAESRFHFKHRVCRGLQAPRGEMEANPTASRGDKERSERRKWTMRTACYCRSPRPPPTASGKCHKHCHGVYRSLQAPQPLSSATGEREATTQATFCRSPFHFHCKQSRGENEKANLDHGWHGRRRPASGRWGTAVRVAACKPW